MVEPDPLPGEISTLVEVPVSYSTGISYYYPYFYKTHLISFPEESNIFFSISSNGNKLTNNTTCNDNNCYDCSYNNTNVCITCNTGFILDDGHCKEYCPENKIADNLRLRCLNKDSQNIDILFSMAYSVGSCHNMCGKMVQDCSCSPSCKQRGSCCTDYETINCDMLVEKSNKTESFKGCSQVKGCDLCMNFTESNTTSIKCHQCSDIYFLHDGKCEEKCPDGYVADNINKLCKKALGKF
jgi:hypothetical protein